MPGPGPNPARMTLRAALAYAARIAHEAGVSHAEVADDLRVLADIYGSATDTTARGGPHDGR